MTVRQRRHSEEALAQLGQELYGTQVRQRVEAGNAGRIVAIDLETGDFEVDDNVVPATIDYLIGIPMHSPGLFGSDIEPLIILER